MADWYVSSVAWAALAQFAASTAYTVGQIIRPLATPGQAGQYAFRCTTAGTTASSEPAWNSINNGTTTSGGATFTNVSGQSTYNWSAPAGNLYSISASATNRTSGGDRIFVSSDHAESLTGTPIYGFANNTATFSPIYIISVNRGGSVPPVAADITSGAAITCSSQLSLDSYAPMFWEGFTFTAGTSSFFYLSSLASKIHYFSNCTLALTGSGAHLGTSGGISVKAVFDNTAVSFSHASQSIQATSGGLDLTWINTASPITGSTLPTSLITGGNCQVRATFRGVDLSALTAGNIFTATTAGGVSASKLLLDSCKIASGVTPYSPSGTPLPASLIDDVELVNCWNGSVVINERHNASGDVTTDRTTYLNSGAADDIGNYSLKLASSARSEKWAAPLECFVFDVENTVTGSSKTATVEIISSGTLNNDDINLLLEYMGTSGNPIASFANTLPATILTTGSALGSSSATWTSPPATPQTQHLQITFTPQRAGRVRGLVRLGKVSTTVWVNPQVTIT